MQLREPLRTLSMCCCWAVSESANRASEQKRDDLCAAEQWLFKNVGCCHRGVTNSTFYKAT